MTTRQGHPDTMELSLTEPMIRLGRDIKQAASEISWRTARWFVDVYYTIQDERIRAEHQSGRMGDAGKPTRLIDFVGFSFRTFESGVKGALEVFSKRWKVGNWLLAQYGIGPVLSAAMLSNFDIRKAPTVGHFWSFAGMNPSAVWKKGTKRPWNAQLKSICIFKMGDVFVKFQARDKCYYGQLFAAKKAELTDMNEKGAFADVAKAEMQAKANVKGAKQWERWQYWEQGKLCPKHVSDRARRWTVKLFLSHLHHVMYWDFYRKDPPAPYVFEHPELGDHRHLLTPPLWPGDYGGRGLADLYGDE